MRRFLSMIREGRVDLLVKALFVLIVRMLSAYIIWLPYLIKKCFDDSNTIGVWNFFYFILWVIVAALLGCWIAISEFSVILWIEIGLFVPIVGAILLNTVLFGAWAVNGIYESLNKLKSAFQSELTEYQPNTGKQKNIPLEFDDDGVLVDFYPMTDEDSQQSVRTN